MNKKGDLVMLLLFLMVFVVFLTAMINTFSGTCKSNSECDDGNYCGVDKECHKIPVIEKTIMKESVSYDLTGPASIVAFGLIVGAVVLKWKMQ